MPYILVLGQNGDATVDDVIHWLKFLQPCKIIRINDSDRIDFINIEALTNSAASFTLEINGTLKIESDQIFAYWYRRGGLAVKSVGFKDRNAPKDVASIAFLQSFGKYSYEEWEQTSDYIHFLLKNIGVRCLNSYFDLRVNKLINAELAKACGLRVPESIISNQIPKIRTFLSKHNKVIVKPIRSPQGTFKINSDTWHYSQGTNLFTLEQLDRIESTNQRFQATLFQQYMEKEFEIRSYWMRSRIYSMAIFSQNNEKTKIDFRNYDDRLPNRIVPFKIPKEIENKISRLMTELNYDSGSIDIIYHKGVYTFLEVNTVGQLQWLSKSCNYYIEKDIAKMICYGFEHRGS